MQLHYPLNPSTGLEDPTQLPWTNGVPATGTEGSYPPFALMTDAQTELVNLLMLAGLTPSDGDMNQVTRAVRGGQLDFAIDVGTADALVAKISLAHTAIKAGLPFSIIKGASANATTTPTLTIEDTSGNNGLTATIVKNNGSAVAIGDLPANSLLVFRAISPTKIALVSLQTISDIVALIQSNAIVPVQALVTLNVDSTSGNDATGTGTTAAPFKTNARALAFASGRYSFGTFGLNLQMLSTTAPYDLPQSIGGIPTITITGNSASPSSYVLAAAGASGSSATSGISGCTVNLVGLTINNTTPTKNTLAVGANGSLNTTNVAMTSTGTLSAAHLLVGATGSLGISGTLSIGTSAASIIDNEGGAATIFGTVAVPSGGSFSDAVIVGNYPGRTVLANGASTFSGTTSGKKFSVTNNAVIDSQGQGVNTIPGTTAGTTATGGQYV